MFDPRFGMFRSRDGRMWESGEDAGLANQDPHMSLAMARGMNQVPLTNSGVYQGPQGYQIPRPQASQNPFLQGRPNPFAQPFTMQRPPVPAPSPRPLPYNPAVLPLQNARPLGAPVPPPVSYPPQYNPAAAPVITQRPLGGIQTQAPAAPRLPSSASGPARTTTSLAEIARRNAAKLVK